MIVDDVLYTVQRAFPQVYFACHTRHMRKRSTSHRLSQRDASILAHLSAAEPVAPGALAAHLGISKSTMSEALKRLVALGFARRAGERSASVLLAEKGQQAISDTSVLETERLRAALASLSDAQRRTVGRGLDTLARACWRSAPAPPRS